MEAWHAAQTMGRGRSAGRSGGEPRKQGRGRRRVDRAALCGFAHHPRSRRLRRPVRRRRRQPSGERRGGGGRNFVQSRGRRLLRAQLKALPDLRVSIETTVAERDKVAASFVYEGAQHGPYYGIEPTRKRLRFTSCDIFHIADGKIVEHWGTGDIARADAGAVKRSSGLPAQPFAVFPFRLSLTVLIACSRSKQGLDFSLFGPEQEEITLLVIRILDVLYLASLSYAIETTDVFPGKPLGKARDFRCFFSSEQGEQEKLPDCIARSPPVPDRISLRTGTIGAETGTSMAALPFRESKRAPAGALGAIA